ncbi:MAG: transhydrogenase [Candidatus Sumerlaeota bacterium]|nr:transhydrogenase [Candidatus Sumerlaeota bacterium]
MADHSYQFDLLVIGSGPAGQKAAISAAKRGAQVGLVERDPMAGGVCLNTGTVPSKSLREAVLYLTGYRQRGYYGSGYRLKEKIKSGDLILRTNHVIQLERDVINEDIEANNVARIVGTARITGPHEATVQYGGMESSYTAANLLVCVGTKPRRPADVPFDCFNVIDSDGLYMNGNELVPLPDSMIVLGAGVIGIEYACMFAALDIPVTLIDPRPNPLSFVDEDIARILYDSMETAGVELVFGTSYTKIEVAGETDGPEARVRVATESGRLYEADMLLFALGRVPATDDLGLAEAGVELDKRGYVKVDSHFRSSVPSIYAAGDVIGFPSLASTSAEQGRIAALHVMGDSREWQVELLPYGIYTIPEISMVGKTEEQLKKEGIGYFTGTALWRDTARGKIVGDLSGALKLLFRTDDQKLAGVHIIGEGATELVHIGQAVMAFGGGPDYFIRSVFNYPTLAEAYKKAAQNAMNRMAGRAHHTAPLSQQVLHGDLHENLTRLSGEVRLPADLL